MDSLIKIFKEIDPIDLFDKELCYFCVAFQIPIVDVLHNLYEMKDGPISSDLKCSHCYITEEEFGRLKLTTEEKIYASYVVKQFKKYKDNNT